MDVTEKYSAATGKLYRFVKLWEGVSDDLLGYVDDMKAHGGLGKSVFTCSKEGGEIGGFCRAD